jgi:hypothetical protein
MKIKYLAICNLMSAKPLQFKLVLVNNPKNARVEILPQ